MIKPTRCVVPVSGGKDSQACVKLAVSQFDRGEVLGLFCDTGYEHPMTYRHVDLISELYGIKIVRVCAGDVETIVRKYKRFPGGGSRHCTKELKIRPANRFYVDFMAGNGPFEVWYGMRAGESVQRNRKYRNHVNDELYPPHEISDEYRKSLFAGGVRFRLPIIDWTEEEVFDYLRGEENPLYWHGFSRVGCFPCLAAGDAHKEKCFNFDETGQKHYLLARDLEPIVGRTVFTSKGGRMRNNGSEDETCPTGCAFCAI